MHRLSGVMDVVLRNRYSTTSKDGANHLWILLFSSSLRMSFMVRLPPLPTNAVVPTSSLPMTT